MAESKAPIVSMRGIQKSYGGVQALISSHGTGPTQRKRCGRRLSK